MDNGDVKDSAGSAGADSGAEGVSRDDVDLRGMEPEAAQEYVLGFIRSLKETQRQKARYLEDLERWRERVKIAQKAGRADLTQTAEERVRDLDEQVGRLTAEEAELASKVKRLKENLKTLEHGFRPSVDAELLQANLDMLVGETDATERKFEDQEAEAALEELKKKLQDGRE